MNDIKKSAVGAATPAAKTVEKIYSLSIAENSGKIKGEIK